MVRFAGRSACQSKHLYEEKVEEKDDDDDDQLLLRSPFGRRENDYIRVKRIARIPFALSYHPAVSDRRPPAAG